MWVVKLGGSLIKSGELRNIVNTLATEGHGKIVIVPGGGIFADQVRLLDSCLSIDAITAHRLCLRAMEQYAEILISMHNRLRPARSLSSFAKLSGAGFIPIWFPYDMVHDNPSIDASWDVTSDTLSLWLANQLGYRHSLLIKSTEPENNNYNVEYLCRAGLIDHAFRQLFSNIDILPFWLHYRRLNHFIELLGGIQRGFDGLSLITR